MSDLSGRLLTSFFAAGSWFFFRTLCRGTLEGEQHLRAVLSEGYILAPNHASYLDWMVLGALFRYRYRLPLTFLAKDRLFRHPLFGPVMRHEKCLRVSDDGGELLSTVDFADARHLCVFPEGKRSRDGRPGAAHAGVVKLAVKLGLPIVPVGLVGFHDAWPADRKLPRARRCAIRFGPPRRPRYARGATLAADVLAGELAGIMSEIGRLIARPAASGPTASSAG